MVRASSWLISSGGWLPLRVLWACPKQMVHGAMDSNVLCRYTSRTPGLTSFSRHPRALRGHGLGLVCLAFAGTLRNVLVLLILHQHHVLRIRRCVDVSALVAICNKYCLSFLVERNSPANMILHLLHFASHGSMNHKPATIWKPEVNR